MLSALLRICDALRKRIQALALLAAVAVSAMLASPYQAQAILANGENAVDILGEFASDSSDASPNYTKSCVNNGATLGFNAPEGSGSVDTVHHRLFVTDCVNNRVLVFTLDGSNLISSKIPANVLGQPNFARCVAGVSQTAMNCPVTAAYDATNDRLFVSDQANSRVLVFDTSSITDGMNAAYVLGNSNFGGAGGGLSRSGLAHDSQIALDTANQILYVSDEQNNRVVSYNVSPGSIANGMNAANVLGQANFTSGSAATTQSRMDAPYGVAFDSANNRLFVGELHNNRVLMFNTAAISNGMNATTVFGQPDFTTATDALTQSSIYAPLGIAFDSANQRLFTTDTGYSRVLVFTPNTIPAGENASDVLGQFTSPSSDAAPNYTKSCVNNGASAIGFNHMQGTAIDATNHLLFVPDTENNRVLVFTLDGGNALSSKTPAHVLGQPDFVSCDAAASQSRMYFPAYVCVDSANQRLFVPDDGNDRVLVFSTASISDGMNASNVLGQPNFTSTGAATTQSTMSGPSGCAYDAANNRLFVAEGNNNRVTVFNAASISNGMNAANVLGQTNFTTSTGGATQSKFTGPEGLSYDGTNTRLFVPDYGNNRVMVFNTSSITNGMNAANVLGQANFTSTGGATTQSGMFGPNDTAYDAVNNRLFVADGHDNSRVLVYNTTTITNGMNAANVLGQPNFASNTYNTTQSGLADSAGLAYDSTNDQLYVDDLYNNRIVIYSTASINNGQNAADLLGQYTSASSTATVSYTKNGYNNGPTALGMQEPAGVALDAVNHRLFVADTYNNRVLVYNLDGSNAFPDHTADYVLGQPDFLGNAAAATQSGMNNPLGLAYDAANNRLFVADVNNHRVLVFNTGSISNSMNAANVLGQANFTSSGSATTQSRMFGPVAVTLDSTNNRLYVADWGNNRVLIFNSASISNGMNAANVLGQANFTGGTTGRSQSRMNGPNGFGVDAANKRLFVGDQNNHRILIYDTTTISNGKNASNVIGQTNFTNGTTGVTQAKMNNPKELAYDAANNRLFVADTSNSRVLVFDVTPATVANGMNAIGVLGQPDFTTNGNNVTQSGMGLDLSNNSSTGMAYDSGGSRLFVADTINNRVMVFSTVANTFSNGQNASYVIGAPDFTSGGGGLTQATMGYTSGVTYDSGNNQLYVSDGAFNRVMIFNTSSITNGQNASDLLGQYTSLSSPSTVTYTTKGGINNGPNALGLNGPQATVLDPVNHRLFVSDTNQNRVLVYNLNTDNSFPDHAADNVLGQPDVSSFDANTSQSGMWTPIGLDFDAVHNRLFVADYQNSRVLVFNTGSITDGMNAANVLGQANFTSNGGVNTQAGMNLPQAVSYDSVNNRLFVADSFNHRVLVYDVAAITNGKNASFELGQASGGTAFTAHSTGLSQSRMNFPDGLALDSANNRLFVAEVANNRVLVFNVATGTIANGENASNVLGQANFTANSNGTTQSKFNSPALLSFDPVNNRLFVADYNNGRILIFNTAKIANGMNASNVLGAPNFTANGLGPTQSDIVVNANGVSYDPATHNIFISDTFDHRIMVFDGSFLPSWTPGYE